MLLMIDNYDSFTYNLVQYFGELGQEVKTFRNDQITIEEIKKLDPKYIVISPGPCTPKESGISMQVIDSFKENKPILGVCLGHQAIGAVFGANIIKAKELMHGKTSEIQHDGNFLFEGMISECSGMNMLADQIGDNFQLAILKVFFTLTAVAREG